MGYSPFPPPNGFTNPRIGEGEDLITYGCCKTTPDQGILLRSYPRMPRRVNFTVPWLLPDEVPWCPVVFRWEAIATPKRSTIDPVGIRVKTKDLVDHRWFFSIFSHMGLSITGGTHKMVGLCQGKSQKWMMTRGTPVMTQETSIWKTTPLGGPDLDRPGQDPWSDGKRLRCQSPCGLQQIILAHILGITIHWESLWKPVELFRRYWKHFARTWPSSIWVACSFINHLFFEVSSWLWKPPDSEVDVK